MRRLLLIGVMGIVGVVPATLQAQRGFGGRMPMRVAPRVGAPVAVPSFRGVPAGGIFVGGRFRRPIFVRPGFRHHHFIFTSNPCFANPFLCSGFFSTPFLLSPPLFWPETQYVQQPYPVVQQVDDSALRSQIDRLTYEVERLREEQESARAAQQLKPQAQRSAVESPATILVFRDGHRSEVRNYAIVGQTLWIFTEQRARKVPLSDLDIPATQAANTERGIEFAVPTH